MAGYVGECQHGGEMKGLGWNIHHSVNLFDMSLPEKEGDNKEHRNDQWREDVGGGPSLRRSRRNGEDKKNDGRCRECELATL